MIVLTTLGCDATGFNMRPSIHIKYDFHCFSHSLFFTQICSIEKPKMCTVVVFCKLEDTACVADVRKVKGKS